MDSLFAKRLPHGEPATPESDISAPAVRKSADRTLRPLPVEKQFELSWTHLADLVRLEDPWKRAFYENECRKGHWSKRQFQRQIGSLLYERSGLSTDKEAVIDHARFTGYTIDGGYADFSVADSRFCFPLPDAFGDAECVPLLCAGLIGYRSLRMAGDASRLGLYGFGAAAHIVTQVARYQGREVFAFTRRDDATAQEFARRMGATWAGGSDEAPPELLDAAIIFAPAGALVPAALRAVRKGGTVVCGGIHMSDIPSLPFLTATCGKNARFAPWPI